jgi:Holliday junction resolvase-like predicted endonuclease
MPANKLIGNLGEDLACIYLKSKGYEIVKRNYNRKWGELDIICRQGIFWHFVEVKTVTQITTSDLANDDVSQITTSSVGQGTSLPTRAYLRAEDNLHSSKLKRVSRAARTYLLENGLDEVDFQIDAVVVKLNIKDKKAKVTLLQNVL